MVVYGLKNVLSNDFVIYPSDDEIKLIIGTTTLARFKLRNRGLEFIVKSDFYVLLFGGHYDISTVTKYRLRPRFDESTIDGIARGYDYLTYDIEYYTTVGSGDPGYDTGYFKMGAIEFKSNLRNHIINGKVKMNVYDNQKVSIIPRQMKTIDLNNSGTFRINNQTMSLK